jgi:deazaflavin-dependent oxidoreductase (nitroreductase family)
VTESLPDIDPYTAATDPIAQQRYNELLIEQFRASGGEATGQFSALPVLLLTTVGARTGTTRVVPLVYFHDDDRYLLVASKAGAPTNPSWYYNLLAAGRASVELGGGHFDVRVRIVEGDERDELFAKVAARFPIYASYQQRTRRRIPIVELKRAD